MSPGSLRRSSRGRFSLRRRATYARIRGLVFRFRRSGRTALARLSLRGKRARMKQVSYEGVSESICHARADLSSCQDSRCQCNTYYGAPRYLQLMVAADPSATTREPVGIKRMQQARQTFEQMKECPRCLSYRVSVDVCDYERNEY